MSLLSSYESLNFVTVQTALKGTLQNSERVTGMPFIIAVCDDDAEQLEYIRRILAEWSKHQRMDVKIESFSCAEQFLFAYPSHPCDILLLDIEMRGLSGMELAKKLRSQKDRLPIIFLTGFSEYISEGYDVEALHYLLKPIDGKKLCEVLDRHISRGNGRAEAVLVRTKDAAMHISAEQIVYVEAFGRKSQIALSDGSYMDCGQKIGHFEQLQGFLHCHRSYLVNLRHVKGITKATVILDTGREIPLSRRLYQQVNQTFIQYYKGAQKSWSDGV